jgi:hypothetical protein
VLAEVLLQRKARAVPWPIGGRLLHCAVCGADRTIPATALSGRCPFCNANQVVEQDALHSFEQPDGLLPFLIGPDDAASRIRRRLASLSQRLLGMFERAAVRRVVVEGLYLPLWLFDVLVDVTQTVTRAPSAAQRWHDAPAPPERNTFRDGVNDVAVFAVTRPHPSLTGELGDYDLSQMRAYAPELLATHPALLYDVDVDSASIEAGGRVARRLHARHAQGTGQEATVSVFAAPVQMTFRLVLAPVWVATLTEVDDEARTALVNGQSGRVVLGKAHRPGAR